MVLLPHLLNGIAIPAAASLLSAATAKTKETSSNKGVFSDMLKSELDSAANGTANVNPTAKLREQAKLLAAEIKKAAETAADRTKDSLSASNANSVIPGVMLLPLNQMTTTVKTDSAQAQKLLSTNVSPTAPSPEAGDLIKLSGENAASLVMVASKDQAANAGLDRYRMENLSTILNKKGVSGNNLMVGLKLPIG
jgi:hypothetical protein